MDEHTSPPRGIIAGFPAMSSSGPGEVRAAVVIEDDLDIRNLVSAILAQGGFQVTGAASGREGVDIVRQEHPVVVTLDIGLPDIDGYEVLRRIRSTTDCYVIVLSGRDDELDILTALQAGCRRLRPEALPPPGTAGADRRDAPQATRGPDDAACLRTAGASCCSSRRVRRRAPGVVRHAPAERSPGGGRRGPHRQLRRLSSRH